MVVMGQEISWDTFILQLAILMDKFERNEISLENLYSSLWKFANVVDGNLLEDFFDTCTEIGGSPGHYSEMKQFILKKPSQQELVDFFGK